MSYIFPCLNVTGTPADVVHSNAWSTDANVRMTYDALSHIQLCTLIRIFQNICTWICIVLGS